jgi:5'-3' exonuclease
MAIARLHLVDGTYELFRAHFTPRPEVTSPSGQSIKATSGWLSSLLALLHDPGEGVTHIAVAFDHPIRSFRNDLFAGYKSEEGVEKELLAQFDLAEEACRVAGVVAWPMDRFECDDALATAATRFASQVKQVRLLTPDKDLAQLVRGSKVVMVDRARQKELDEPGVIEKFGVEPASIPDLLALVGDDTDGIPGLDGWGAKGAATVLRAYRHLERIPADSAKWSVKVARAPTLAATLTAQRDDALLYRKLATLMTDVPLKDSLDALRWEGVPRKPFEAFCDRLGFRSIKMRPKRWR